MTLTRSLLELLKNEDDMIRRIEEIDREALRVRAKLTNAENVPIECLAKELDIEHYGSELTKWANRREAEEKNLAEARLAIREYFKNWT